MLLPKKEINVWYFIRAVLILQVAIVYPASLLIQHGWPLWIVIVIDILIGYILSAFLIKKVIFSSETISINYPTRLINKNVKFGLSEIARVKYVYGSGSGDMQELRIRVKDKGAFTITYSGSSEDVLYLLEMLEKKGIPIKIRSRILGIKNSVSKVKAK